VAPLLLQVQAFSAALSLSPSDALVLLLASSTNTDTTGADLLAPSAVEVLSQEWRLLSMEVGLPLSEVMAALAGQLSGPDAR
jgi:hypothetical protein